MKMHLLMVRLRPDVTDNKPAKMADRFAAPAEANEAGTKIAAQKTDKIKRPKMGREFLQLSFQ